MQRLEICFIVPPFILPTLLDPLILGTVSFMDMLRWALHLV